jgi:hypothetical protein
MKNHLVFFLCFVAFCWSCDSYNENPSPIPKVTLKSYIYAFVDGNQVDSLQMKVLTESNVDQTLRTLTEPLDSLGKQGIALKVQIRNQLPTSQDSSVYYYSNVWPLEDEGKKFNDERRTGYQRYINEIGDTSFNFKTYVGDIPMTFCLINTVRSVKITSDQDFGEQYPAGVDLSGLFTMYYDNPYATVKNGYRQVSGTCEQDKSVSYPISVFKSKLPDIDFNALKFISTEWYLFLDDLPEHTAEYAFHVEIVLSDGTILKGRLPGVSIKGSAN